MSSFNYYDAKRVWSKTAHCLVVSPGQTIQCSGWKKSGVEGTKQAYTQCQTELRQNDTVYCHVDCWNLSGNYEVEYRCVYCVSCMQDKDGFTDQTDLLMKKAVGGQSQVTEYGRATLHVFPDATQRNAKMVELINNTDGDEERGMVQLQ